MSANKECELPAADSCGLAEGEEPEDDMVYSQKTTLLGKLRAIANKVSIWYVFKTDCALHGFFTLPSPSLTSSVKPRSYYIVKEKKSVIVSVQAALKF